MLGLGVCPHFEALNRSKVAKEARLCIHPSYDLLIVRMVELI